MSTPRPAGSYRGARRNEARNARKANDESRRVPPNRGKRVPMLTYAELLQVAAMAKANRAKAADHG